MSGNLPDGCTQRDIDEALQEPSDTHCLWCNRITLNGSDFCDRRCRLKFTLDISGHGNDQPDGDDEEDDVRR